MQLVEQGKIKSIYDNVNNYLDEGDMTAFGYAPGDTWLF